MTKYAEMILTIINESHDHMTAEQIFLALKKTEPKIVLATVYNNLNTLCNEELIRKVPMDGSPDRYDKIKRHDHLICKRCGKLSDTTFIDLTRHLNRHLGEDISSYDLKIFYICPKCRALEEKQI